jgi:hypothetical protein
MIPERYKSKGFNKVGQKKQSTRPGKKWMVLAKKGESYKIVHGGDDSMQDYTQHHSEERRKNFWNRMGGKDSSKAQDPFSPLYWHKRFGTWAYGGENTMEGEQDSFNPYMVGLNDIPMFGPGGQTEKQTASTFSPYQQNKPIVDRGNFSNIEYRKSDQIAKQNENATNKRIAQQQLQNELSARKAKEKGTTFTLPTGATKKYKDMNLKERSYVDAQSLKNKGRWNENQVEQPFLNSFNPITMLYDMGAGLGEAPLMSDVTNSYMPYVTGVATPLAVGALAGIGTNTTGQFVNNLTNPLAGTGELIDNLGNKYLPNAYKINPLAFQTNSNSYYRMLGEDGLNDLAESQIIRSNQNTYLKNRNAYFSKGAPIDGRYYKSVIKDGNYKGPYMAEVKGTNEIGNRFARNRNAYYAPDKNIFVARDNISINNPNLKIYEQDWLRGYKPVNKSEIFTKGQPYEGAPYMYQDMYPTNKTYYPRTVITDAGVKDEILGLESTPIFPLNTVEYPTTDNKFLNQTYSSFGRMEKGRQKQNGGKVQQVNTYKNGGQHGGLLNKQEVKDFLQYANNPILSQEPGVRAHYDPITNIIHYDNESDLIPEFAHVVQKMDKKIGGNSVPLYRPTMMTDNNQNSEIYTIKDRKKLDSNYINNNAGYLNQLKINNNADQGSLGNAYVKPTFGNTYYPQSFLDKVTDNNFYFMPGTAEYDAHQIIEPTLGSYLTYKNGGQHGGLDRWFAEKWVDIKTGKPCGRKEGENRDYPACRPSKRISEGTPKTASELSASEKEKFKNEKTSSQRISYNHNRKQYGGDNINNINYMKYGGNIPTNSELWSRAKAVAKSKYDVYPSAYANGFAAKWYKERGGGWKKAQVMANGGIPNNSGFKALPEYVQQSIINNMEAGGEKMPREIAYARVAAAGNLNQLGKYGYKYGGEEDVYWRTKQPMVNDPSMDAISKVLLQRNQNKNFMQRAAGFGNQNSIPTKYIDGQDPNNNGMSNLLMGFGDNYVSPTITETFPNFLGNNSTMLRTAPGQLSYQPDQRQEYIKTPTEDIADYFAAKGYKRAANDMYGMNYKNGGNVPMYGIGGENTAQGEQSAFNKYMMDYFKNNPDDAEFNPNVVNPDSTFEVSDELKNRLKKNRQEISPIRKYGENLQYDIKTGTGQFDFSPEFQGFNALAQITTGVANMANDAKARRYENDQYLKALMPQPKYNVNEGGLNNIPMYGVGGQNPPKVYTDKELLDNPEMLQKFVQSRDNYKFAYGGSMDNAQDGVQQDPTKQPWSPTNRVGIRPPTKYEYVYEQPQTKEQKENQRLEQENKASYTYTDRDKYQEAMKKYYQEGADLNKYNKFQDELYKLSGTTNNHFETASNQSNMFNKLSFKDQDRLAQEYGAEFIPSGTPSGNRRNYVNSMEMNVPGKGTGYYSFSRNPYAYTTSGLDLNKPIYNPATLNSIKTGQYKMPDTPPVKIQGTPINYQPGTANINFGNTTPAQIIDNTGAGYKDPASTGTLPITKYSLNRTMERVGATNKPLVTSAPNYTSIIDLLNARKQDSSFSNRKRLAEERGIKNYIGSASQNTDLINRMNNGKLSGAEMVPPSQNQPQGRNQKVLNSNNPLQLKNVNFSYKKPITNSQNQPQDQEIINSNDPLQLKNVPFIYKRPQGQPQTQPQQGNRPVYGPGNTIIGYSDDNMQFYPANEYTGAANNQSNLQDQELLNNPELLQKYVQSKDTYKFAKGGETNAKFFKILRDGEVNGKKLTDKQRKFFGVMAFKKYGAGGDTFQYDDVPYTPPAEWNKEKSNPQNDWLKNLTSQWTLDPRIGNMQNDPFIGPPYYPDYENQYSQNDWLKNLTAQFTVDPRMGNAQNNSFIGPPYYPDSETVEQDGEWTFTPQRVDYNKKYVPLPKKQATKTTPSTKTQSPATTPIKTQPPTKTTPPVKTQTQKPPTVNPQPQTTRYIPKKRADDIWNNPNGYDRATRPTSADAPTWDLGYRKNLPQQKQVTYPSNNSYLPRYQQGGGLNEGMEADLSLEQIKQLQSQGYKIEIL